MRSSAAAVRRSGDEPTAPARRIDGQQQAAAAAAVAGHTRRHRRTWGTALCAPSAVMTMTTSIAMGDMIMAISMIFTIEGRIGYFGI